MKPTIIVNENRIDWEKGLTIDGILKKMNYTFKMLVVSVNGTLVKKDEYETYEVPEGAEVKVIHLIAGG